MPISRDVFVTWLSIPTRWEDFDLYGHVNNVKYYAYFDTLINEFLMRVGGMRPHEDAIGGYIVESQCTFKGSFAFPEVIEGGLRVIRLGRTSVTYQLGLFRKGESLARAVGQCTHVFVTKATGEPTPIPEPLRAALAQLHSG